MDTNKYSNFEEDYSNYPDGSRIVSEEMYYEEKKALNEAYLEDLQDLLLKGLLTITGIAGVIYLIKKLKDK